jgi:transposase
MPPSLSLDLKERIVKWYFEDGLTYREIRDQGRVSLSVISTTIRNYREFGQVKNRTLKSAQDFSEISHELRRHQRKGFNI